MASVKSALVIVTLLALGVGLGHASFCSGSLDTCFATYSFSTNFASDRCVAYRILKGCVSALTGPGTCSDSEVSAHANIQAAYSDNMTCGGSLPKASVIGIVIAAVVGLLFRA